MRIVAIRAGKPRQLVRRRMPLVHVSPVVALQAELLPSLLFHIAVRIVTGCAIELLGMAIHVVRVSARGRIVTRSAFEGEGNSDLMRMDEVLQVDHLRMAPVAHVRGNSRQVVTLFRKSLGVDGALMLS